MKDQSIFFLCDQFINSHKPNLLTIDGYGLEKIDVGHHWDFKG